MARHRGGTSRKISLGVSNPSMPITDEYLTECGLWVRPLIHITDYKVEAVPNADFSKAQVTADIAICNMGKKKAKNVSVFFKTYENQSEQG